MSIVTSTYSSTSSASSQSSQSSIAETQRALKDKIRISGDPLSDEWGAEGLKVWIARVRIYFGKFHWGVIIQCTKTGIAVVFNRDLGLDVGLNCTFKEALDVTKNYLVYDYNEGNKYL